MKMSETGEQRSVLSMIADPPNAIAGICALMAGVQAGLAFVPTRIEVALWRMFELSPKPVLLAIDRGDIATAARVLLGHMFFHVNFVHLLLNLTAVLVLGGIVYREMEARPKAPGSDAAAAFVAFFLISGMAAATAFILASPQSYQPMIGASGGAAGLAGACTWLFVTRTEDGERRPGAARNFFMLLIVSAALIALGYYLDTSRLSTKLFGNVSAWQAHTGGYVFGVLAYPLFERLARAARPA